MSTETRATRQVPSSAISSTSPHSESPITGRLDLHSHLLPGIDDGCRTVDDSLACVRRLMEQGYTGTVCTPHVILDEFPRNTPVQIARWVASLQEQIRDAGLDYRLWAGGELRIHPDTTTWLDWCGVPTLGPSRAVLVDWWGRDWPEYAYETLQYLLDRGYAPILAHPERMGFCDELLRPLLEELTTMGVRLQGNFNSISGGEGPSAEACALRLLAEDRYHLLATDMHRPEHLDGRIAGLQRVEREYGSERLTQYVSLRTHEIVFGS